MEKSVIDSDILVIDGTVEGESDHHGQVGDLKFAAFDSRSLGAIRGAEAVREKTFSKVTHLQKGIFKFKSV